METLDFIFEMRIELKKRDARLEGKVESPKDVGIVTVIRAIHADVRALL